MTDPDPFLSTADVAALANLSPAYVGALRRSGAGPRSYRRTATSAVLYRQSDVLLWLAGAGVPQDVQ